MPTKAKPPRLILRSRADGDARWSILDRGKEIRTGCSASDLKGAEEALASYLAKKRAATAPGRGLAAIPIADVLNAYLLENTAENKEFIRHTAAPILDFWGELALSDVKKAKCLEYVAWRTGQGVKDSTAAHDLSTLRAAINHWHKEYGPLPAVPFVTMPDKVVRKEDYFLTRKQAADRLRAARRLRFEHVKRMIIIGIYSGTRPGASMGLSWTRKPVDGWVDLENRLLYRAGAEKKKSKKRQTKARVHDRLLPWLRRWRAKDLERGIDWVVHYKGQRISKFRRSWASVAIEAGHAREEIQVDKKTGKAREYWVVDDGPHILRHTCVTWLVSAGVSYHETGGFTGMSEDTIRKHYGHHAPDYQTNAASHRSGHGSAMHRMNPTRTSVQDRA